LVLDADVLVFAVGANLAFAWIRADSEERGYKLQRLFPVAVAIFGALALIYYLFKSRVFVAAMSSIGWLLLYCICLFLAIMIILAIVMTIA
jgi:amino acid transporter